MFIPSVWALSSSPSLILSAEKQKLDGQKFDTEVWHGFENNRMTSSAFQGIFDFPWKAGFYERLSIHHALHTVIVFKPSSVFPNSLNIRFYNLVKVFWNGYVFEGYVNYSPEMILLAGFPDTPLSMPQSKESCDKRGYWQTPGTCFTACLQKKLLIIKIIHAGFNPTDWFYKGRPKIYLKSRVCSIPDESRMYAWQQSKHNPIRAGKAIL